MMAHGVSRVEHLAPGLKKEKGPVEMLIVDHVETTPAEN
jgi:hypothetical protein